MKEQKWRVPKCTRAERDFFAPFVRHVLFMLVILGEFEGPVKDEKPLESENGRLGDHHRRKFFDH